MPVFKIADHSIGADCPCFVIAEAGVNHNGDMDLARKLIEVSAKSGAHAVKFQSFKTEKLVTKSAPKADYQARNTGKADSQDAMLRKLELTAADHRDLQDHSRKHGILFLSTPFDETSADLLDSLGVPAFKISSGEVTNLPFLEHIAKKGKPVVLSTGMATLGEVQVALQALQHGGNPPVALLHCVSNYPARASDTNLRAMRTMEHAFGVPIGYSDHTLGIEVSLAAVALGACIIEKHFTLDRAMPGPDHAASAEPAELTALVQGIRNVQAALGHGRKEPAASEANTAAVARRSIVASRDIPAKQMLDRDALALLRPGTGLPPAMLPYVIGRRARQDIKAGDLISLDILD
jgi:N,N'-diacetyllegionaminate synthase